VGPKGSQRETTDDPLARRVARLEAAFSDAPAEARDDFRALTQAAIEAWPFELTPTEWVSVLSSRWAAGGSLDGPGLYLIAACLERVPEALSAFDVELRAAAAPALRRMGLDASASDEVLQATRAHLLVSPEAAPRLAGYSGRAPLRDWLATVVSRQAFDLQRRRRNVVSLGAVSQHEAAALNPEITLLRADQRAHLTSAIADALQSLSPRQRALLRLHVVERLSIDELAPLFAASRASLARWVEDARQQLGASTRRAFASRLGIDASEVDSLLPARSLELSLVRLLSEQTPTPDE